MIRIKKGNTGERRSPVWFYRKKSILVKQTSSGQKKRYLVWGKSNKRSLLGLLLAVAGITALLGTAMKLKAGYMAGSVAVSLVFAPFLLKNNDKSKYERERFEEVNAYMSQMAQSFTSTKRILMSLIETKNTFGSGCMNQMLGRMVWHIENSGDARLSEQEALVLLQEEYDCERIRTLHDFLMKAQHRGGTCEGEFRLLEHLRQAWEKAVTDYHNKIQLARNLVAAEYIVLVLICAFMLSQFPEDLSISGFPAVQMLNVLAILCFWLILERMDHKLTNSLLRDGALMSAGEAEKIFSYLEHFTPKKEVIKSLPLSAGIFVISLMMSAAAGKPGIALMGGLISGGLLHRHYLRSTILKQRLRTEMKRAFPKWLFDVLLLIQCENVPVAIFLSIQKAAPVLRKELRRMQERLEEVPDDAGAFMEFLGEYQIPGVEGTMRKLYSLSVGTGGTGEVMKVIVDSNMSLLAEAERKKLDQKGQMFSAYYMLPTIPVMICMAGYGLALMAVIFQNVMSVI